MKKVVMSLFLLPVIFCFNIANADVIPTETIGWAESDGVWFGATYPLSSYLDRGNKEGIARRFQLDNYYNVSSISGFLKGVQYSSPDVGGATFFLHQGSGYRSTGPNFFQPSGRIIYQSEKFAVPQDNQGSWYGESNLNLTLSPGDYWFAAQGGAPIGSILLSDYKLEGEVTTPEPATILLLGGGLAGAIWRRRKVTKV